GLWFLSRLNRVDRLAIWIVRVCLIVIGYLHNANTWTADERGFGKPADIAMWKNELILGIALAVPLLHTLARSFRRTPYDLPDSSSPASSRSTSISSASLSFSGAEMSCSRARWSLR